MQNLVIIGATSAIAQATARRYAADGCRFLLLARNEDRLEAVAADLRARGAATVEVAILDVRDLDRHPEVVELARGRLEQIDIVLIAHGTLIGQASADLSMETLVDSFNVNALSSISLATLFANLLETQGSGCLAVISSVAGERGRKSNYCYGAAKAAVTAYCSGLRNRLAESGVHVLTIKPGLIDSPMTASFSKGAFWSTPERVARDVELAITKRRDVIYSPWFWRLIMIVIRSIPECIFKRLSL